MSRHHGRHRKVLTRRTASPPLLAASGTMAVAALTAVVLSGQDSPDGSAGPPSDNSRSSLTEPRDPGLLADPLLLAGLSLDQPGALGNGRTAAALDGPVATMLAQAVAAAQSVVQPGAQSGVAQTGAAGTALAGARPPGGLPGVTPTGGAGIAPVTDVIAPVTKPVPDLVAPITEPVTEVVAPVVEPVVEPVAEAVAPVVAPVTEAAAPVAKPATAATAPLVKPTTAATAPLVEEVTDLVEPSDDEVSASLEQVGQLAGLVP